MHVFNLPQLICTSRSGSILLLVDIQSIAPFTLGFPGGSDGKESACSVGDPGSIPGLGRSTGDGYGYPLQYSCLENSMDRGAWWATVYGVEMTFHSFKQGCHEHRTSSWCVCVWVFFLKWNCLVVGYMQLQLYKVRPQCFTKCLQQHPLPPTMSKQSCCLTAPTTLGTYQMPTNLTGSVLYLLLLGIAGNSAALRQVLSCVWPFGSPHPPVAYSYVLAFTKSGQFVFFRIDLQNSLYSLEKKCFFVVVCMYCRHTLVCLWLVFPLCDVFGCPGALNCNKVNLSPLWLRLFIACWE